LRSGNRVEKYNQIIIKGEIIMTTPNKYKSTSLDTLCVNTLRFLAVDMVQQAQSGHPGLPMGSAAMAYALWDRFLKFNPRDPAWTDRDRFVLSAGHGCALLYALLHLTGFDLPLEELKHFRQWGSRTPGHPEVGMTPGIEVTTGPLGQGLANAVGMAIAETALAARFNRPEHTIVNHHTYVLASDGDLMEGLSSEAASLAGHLKLGKLIVLYADNHISIEGGTGLAFTENRPARFAAFNWHVQQVADGNDIAAVAAAIQAARTETDRPSFIDVQTHIGYGSPHKQDTASAHGEPLGEEEVHLAKENLGWPLEPSFCIPQEALDHFRRAVKRGLEWQVEWNTRFQAYAEADPDLAADFNRAMRGQLPTGWDADLPVFTPEQGPVATRAASGVAINAIARHLPELMGGSADLAPSTHTRIKDAGDFEPDNRTGRNMHFGIREHAMGAILNGMARHGGFRPYGATFLIFSDYMRPPMRLAAMNGLPVIYVFTHDSIALGEDGPTHQPVEQLLGLRSIPGLTVIRPADANETVAAWRKVIEHRRGPVALVLTRQKLPVLDPSQHQGLSVGVQAGGYVAAHSNNGAKPDVIIVATGSEVHLALAARTKLISEGVNARVVSMPALEWFKAQPIIYRNRVLSPGVSLLAVEAGLPLRWQPYLGPRIRVVGVKRFGASAPGETVLREYGLTVDNVCKQALDLLQTPANLGNHLLVAMDNDPDSLELVRYMAQRLPDPADTDVTLMHYLAPMFWITGAGTGEMYRYDWEQIRKLEEMEATVTDEYFSEARVILQESDVAAVHVHTQKNWESVPDVARAVLDELANGVYTAVVVGRHHHHALTRLLNRDPGDILTKLAKDVAVWVVKQD
jgi:transketolase